MPTQLTSITDMNEQLILQEYSLLIDGVIEIKSDKDPNSFFAGLLDAILEYVEKQEAQAGLTMTHQVYTEEAEEVSTTNGTARA